MARGAILRVSLSPEIWSGPSAALQGADPVGGIFPHIGPRDATRAGVTGSDGMCTGRRGSLRLGARSRRS